MKDNIFTVADISLSNIFPHLDNIFIILNLKGHIIEFNSIAEHYYGHSKTEVIGENFIDFCKKNQFQIPSFLENLNIIVEKGIQEFSQVVQLPSGKKHSAEWKVFPLYDSSYVLQGTALIGKDTTQTQNAENDLKNITSRLDGIIESIAGNHWWKDIEGRYRGFNGALVKELGLRSTEDIIGKTDYDMPWVMGATQLINNDQEVIETGLAQTREEQVYLKDGNIMTFLVTKVPLRDGDGKIIGTIGTSFDITEQKNAQAQLLIDKERAEIANKAKSEFMANISHDLRTPLAGILGMSEILEKKTFKEDKIMAAEIVQASKVLLNLFNEIIDYLKIETNSPPLHYEQIEIESIVQDIFNLMLPSAKLKKLRFEANLDPNLPSSVIGDASRFNRILINIVGNAIKFTLQGHVIINVELAKQTEREVIIKITVEDTGIGMPEDQLDKIFTRFTRLTSAHQGIFSGSGLGLSIVKQFIEEMNGEIHVESVLNKGSKFICIFPFKKSLLDEKIIKSKKDNFPLTFPTNISPSLSINDSIRPERKSLNLNRSSPQILLIEDDTLAQKVGTLNFEDLLCTVDVASSGQEAIHMFKQKNYDLVITDIGLPDMDGFEITSVLRTLENDKGQNVIPIIALTAHIDKRKEQDYSQVGLNDILIKPLTMDLAKDILNKYFQIKESKKIENKKEVSKPTTDSSSIDPSIIDLNLGAEIIQKDQKAAKEMLDIMLTTLPDEQNNLKIAYEKNNHSELLQIAHKLHGGACYCGTPSLKFAAENLEKILLADDKAHIKVGYELLIIEINNVINAYRKLDMES